MELAALELAKRRTTIYPDVFERITMIIRRRLTTLVHRPVAVTETNTMQTIPN